MGRIAVVLFVGLCFAMAGGTYALAFHQPTQTFQQAEAVEGTVQSTEVEVSSSDTGSAYTPVITYEYAYGGQTYTNDDYALVNGPGYASPGGAEEFLQSYSAGDRVTVYVVPGNPSKSFLKRGSVGMLVYGIIAGIALMGLFGVAALVADLRGVEAVNIH